ncbi:MAG: MBL fold metallo-hydrolase [Acidimicrobiia bacterium]
MGTSVSQIGDRLYLIDAMMWGVPERLACYYYDTPEPVLVECGPSLTLPHLVDALVELGIDDIATLLVTHIHLDHAGAAGHLARRYSHARIGVHERGARHLSSPGRLLASAERIYGEEGMRELWGSMLPIDEGRLLVLDEGDRVPLGGGETLDVLYTPGHAKHHVVFHDGVRGGMYVGDAVGVAFPHGHFVQPNTPPPDLDPPLLVRQLHRMAERNPTFLGFAHYGVHDDPATALMEAEDRLDEWVRFVEALGESDPDVASDRLREWTIAGYRESGVPEDVISEYASGTFWPMQATGILRWLSLRDR